MDLKPMRAAFAIPENVMVIQTFAPSAIMRKATNQMRTMDGPPATEISHARRTISGAPESSLAMMSVMPSMVKAHSC